MTERTISLDIHMAQNIVTGLNAADHESLLDLSDEINQRILREIAVAFPDLSDLIDRTQ